uniref:Uncharacterized protein n=1 Tax=Peronospora matthiolae TaxID=2874970 RepID=A0AAV1UH04_9STRA
MPPFRALVLLVSAVLLLNRACCSIPTKPAVATSDDQAKKYTTADSISGAHASYQVLEARAEASGGFFQKLVNWFKGIMAKFPQLFGLSRQPVMAEIREPPVVSGTRPVRRPEPDVRTESIVKVNYVGKLGQPSVESGTLHVRNADAEAHPVTNDNGLTSVNAVVDAYFDAYLNSGPTMHKVTNWDDIKKQIDIESFIAAAKLPPLTEHPAAEVHTAAFRFAKANILPDEGTDVFQRFKREADGDRDLAQYLSLRSSGWTMPLVPIICASLHTNAFREEGMKMMIYMMQDMAARSWNPKFAREVFKESFVNEEKDLVDAFYSLYDRYYELRNKLVPQS